MTKRQPKKTVDQKPNKIDKKLEISTRQLIQAERNNVLTTFFAGTMHEINNPLSAALGYIEYAHERAQLPNVKEALQKGMVELQRSVRIAGNILYFARVQKQSNDEVTVFEPMMVIQRVLELFRHKMDRSKLMITIEGEDHLKVTASETAFQQILTNLLANAVDAAEKTENTCNPINIVFSQKNGCLTCSVADSAQGIPSELHEQIFEPFFSTKSAGQGSGLGLAVCKELAHKQGGDVILVKSDDTGSTFEVNLKAEAQHEQ